MLINYNQSIVQKELDEWVNVLSPYLTGSDCSLLLGNYSKAYSITDASINPNKQKEFHQYLHNWSVDNCFEFVLSPHHSGTGNTNNNDTDEKESENMNTDNFYGYNSPLFAAYDPLELGHSRISSALQCVMWPNMTRNPPKPRPGGSGSILGSKLTTNQPLLSTNNVSEEKVTEQKEKQTVSTTNDDNNAGVMEEKDQFRKHDKVKLIGLKSKEHWNGKIAEIMGPFSKTKKRWPVELTYNNEPKKALIQTKNLVLEKKGPRWNQSAKKKAVIQPNTVAKVEETVDEEKVIENTTDIVVEVEDKDDVGLESKMSSFQSLLDEMQQVRSDAKSGKLTDEERRSRAAETAMKLMSYMGLDNEDPNGLFDEMDNEIADNSNQNENE